MKKILGVLVLLAFLSGCIQPTETPDSNDLIKDIEVEEKAEVPKPVTETVVQQPEDVSDNPFLTALSCNPEGTLTYTVKNPLENKLSLVPLSALDSSSKEPFRLTVNGRIIRDLKEDCGKTLLEPEETVKCKTSFTPNDLKSSVVVRLGKDNLGTPLSNYMQGKATKLGGKTEFIC